MRWYAGPFTIGLQLLDDFRGNLAPMMTERILESCKFADASICILQLCSSMLMKLS
jgi:hypothetical protein